MLILGIDPGAMKTGVAWVSDSSGRPVGYVSTVKSEIEWPHRYAHVRVQLETLFQWLPEEPTAVAIEEPSLDNVGQSPTERFSIYHLCGIYGIVVAEVMRTWKNVAVMPWKPMEWRGLGMNKKDVMKRMAAKYGVQLDNDDEGDALGIADHAFMLLSRNRTRAATLRMVQKPPAEGNNQGKAM
jgi:Holliday junction resolvasome RuvABC endonuclease subunit